MIVLKTQLFNSSTDLVKFVNINKIKKEDILFINERSINSFTLFFYGDSETEEINRGFFGW